MLSDDSIKLCKKKIQLLNDSDNSSSSYTSINSSSSLNSKQTNKKIKIQKSFYNKDACESVTKSLLTIDEATSLADLQTKYSTIKKSKKNFDHINKSLSTHLNQSLDSALLTNPKQIGLVNTNDIENIEQTTSSCTKFLDLLLTDQQVLTPSSSSSSSVPSPISSSNSSINFKTLPNTKKLIKRLSIKSNNSTIQLGFKFINKVLTKNSSIPELNDNKMHRSMNTELFLPSKKLRKLLPFNYGLKNHGNTCFMNCILQSLFHSSQLIQFFLTRQFDNNIRNVQDQSHVYSNNKQIDQFILSKNIRELLISLWKNTYDSSYSSTLKQIIGYLNPVFAGVNQNDSHEFCVWLLDRLSQELTYKIQKPLGIETFSIIESFFKIEFKSTVICSKCNYKSSKLETDMMLSLPLPQLEDLQNKISTKKLYRRSLYCNLIIFNENSIRRIMMTNNSDMGKSSFYVSDDKCYKIPFMIKIGVNLTLSNSNDEFEHVSSKVNPTFEDLRSYIADNFSYLNSKNLIFINMIKIEKIIEDSEQIRDILYPNLASSVPSTTTLHILEINEESTQNIEFSTPSIRIVAFNAYDKLDSNGNKINRSFGLPFFLTINRDCSYSELCKQILNSQARLFKDRNLPKYKQLAERLFTISLITRGSKDCIKINASDELPLYAECIDKVLEDFSKNSKSNTLEHIRLLVKWRSFENINELICEIDPLRVDHIHKTAQKLFDLDESDNNVQADVEESPKSFTNKLVTLKDCFDMFTQCEELSDDNSWTCTECKKQTNAYKKLNISSVPPILIIHLKRFFYKSKTSNFKLTTPVWFPVTNLDMSNYIKLSDGSNDDEVLNDSYSSDASNSINNSKYTYDLYAVCNHKGQNMANGHYTAYCKNPVDTRWYCFDDSFCTPLFDSTSSNSIFNNGHNNICTENAYILFYKRRNCMKDEKWWINYIDSVLRDYNEFDAFFSNYDLIESKQNEFQNKEQKAFLKSQFQTKIIPAKYYDTKRRVEIEDKSFLTGYSYDIPINHYDEANRPKRLSVKNKTQNTSLNNSPSKLNYSNSPSTASSSSKDTNNTIPIITSDSSNYPYTTYEDPRLMNKFNNLSLNDYNEFFRNKEKDDIYNYPSDNTYTYNSIYHPIRFSSGNIKEKDNYPKNYTQYTNNQYSMQSVYQNPYASSDKRQSNLSPNSATNRYANPKSIETPI